MAARKLAKGRPRKADKVVTPWVVRPPELLERLKAAAREADSDVSEILCRLAEDYLRRRRKERR